jgi:pimeloyl-ACP methyl ester carboxylesterase
MPKTIMLIHGAWLNGHCWKGFKTFYEAKGYTVLAPSWPLDDRPPVELRNSPHADLRNVGLVRVLEHYEREIRALPEQPILIGHSFGGTVTQFLLDRGFGAAGVAIDPAPTSGVLVGRQTIVSTFPVFFSLGSWRRVMTMSRKFFGTRFAQTVPLAEQGEAYDRYIVPTPGKIYWDGLWNAAGNIRWDNPSRAPLLLIGGGKDLIAPSRTDIKIFADRSHWTCLAPGWEEVADYALNWAAQNAREGASGVRPLNPVRAA